jgi:serine/threonine protein kinase
MRLAVGTKLDSYEILALLGSGGMGEVYRARDSRLKREVAIKILPLFVSEDADRLRRFEQEAQAAAALNHPNILAVHHFGSIEGAPYLVSELLEGGTVRQHLAHGALPLRKAIDYGVQIARGLAAAHEKGIVHRDLKPENLFVTRDERVKILDFGLAKLTQVQATSDDWGPTAQKETDPGVVMGTVGYMSPEQVQGKAADYRADIFALGAILYEMLAGKRAFARPTSPETMTAVLREDPPAISQVTPSTPPGLQRVVHRCLEKKPGQRFQSASDLAFALEALSEPGDSPAHAVEPGSRWRRILVAAGAAVVMLAALFLAWWRISPPAPVVESVTQLTDDGQPKVGGFASDASRLYLNEGPLEAMKIVQVSVAGGRTSPVETNLASPAIVNVARDGSMLLVMVGALGESKKSVWSIPLPAGEPRFLVQGVGDSDILPDGRIVFAKENDSKGADVLVADGDGSNQHTLISIAGGVGNVEVSPDGSRIIFLNEHDRHESLNMVQADGSGLHTILEGGELEGKFAFNWSPDGRYLVYLDGKGKRSDIWALPIQTGFLRRKREPIQLTSGPVSYADEYTSRDGKRIFAVGAKTYPRIDVAPDGAPIISPNSSSQEIYVLNVRWP